MELEQQLLPLWKQIFGDHQGFWELFLAQGYSRDRCRYLSDKGQLTAALCWFDCQYREEKWAYLYAVMTHPAHRGKGLCRKLMADTHAHLKQLGYTGVLLVPAEESLRPMYEKMGYETCTRLSVFTCDQACNSIPQNPTFVPLKPLSIQEYAARRRQLLPPGGVIQEGENLAFLSAQAELLGGKDVLLAAWREGDTLQAMEFLGDPAEAPRILKSLGCKTGIFRTPGPQIPWAMAKILHSSSPPPTYFAFAFD